MAKKKTLSESLKEVLGEPVDTEAVTNTETDPDTVVEDVEVVDETTAADSLHPAARSIEDPQSKFSMITKAIGAMHSMSSDELTKWYTSSVAQIGKETEKLPSAANSDANKATHDMKPSDATVSVGPKTKDPMIKIGVKEDVVEMLAGFELTEETQDQITTLFEAAVTARVIVENARLEEQFETKLQEAIGEVSEDLADQIDNYLTYVVENFMEENKVAIESSLRNELVGEFIDGMKNLFKEHYIEVPETKVDVVEALSDKVTELEEKFNEQLDENVQLREALVEVEREKLVDTYLEGLALSQADKFLKLVEGVDFDGDLEAYSKKLSIVKENYFSTSKTKVPAGSTNIEEETFEGDSTSTVHVDPTIAKYMESINRNLHK
ncbi:MAG: hypothetical protein ACXV2C_00545 [Candidatus Bathyarchaeia archaeon]